MVNSLWDLWGGDQVVPGGQDFGNILAQNRNSLVGLGLGLASGGLPAGMQGYQTGATTDAATQYRMAQMKQHQQELALRQKQFAFQQQQAGVTEAQKAYRDIYGDKGTPEQQQEFFKNYYAPKTEEWVQGTYKNPVTEEERPYQVHKRTGQVRWLELPGLSSPGTTAVAQPPGQGMTGGAVGYGQAGMGPEGFGTGPATTTPSTMTPAAPAALGAPGARPTITGPQGQTFETPAGMLPSEQKEYRKAIAAGLGKRQVSELERTELGAKSAAIVNDAIDRATNTIQANPNTTTGLIGKAYGAISPSSPAGTLAGLLGTIKANVAVSNINQMRQASPTGGALGNVSDKDMAKMEAMMGDLEQSRDSKELLYNLGRVKRAYQAVTNPTRAGDILTDEAGPPSIQPPSGRRTGGPAAGGTQPRPDPFGLR